MMACLWAPIDMGSYRCLKLPKILSLFWFNSSPSQAFWILTHGCNPCGPCDGAKHLDSGACTKIQGRDPRTYHALDAGCYGLKTGVPIQWKHPVHTLLSFLVLIGCEARKGLVPDLGFTQIFHRLVVITMGDMQIYMQLFARSLSLSLSLSVSLSLSLSLSLSPLFSFSQLPSDHMQLLRVWLLYIAMITVDRILNIIWIQCIISPGPPCLRQPPSCHPWNNQPPSHGKLEEKGLGAGRG